MSAPDVNLDRQKRRHSTMIRGVWIGLLIAVGVAAAWAVAHYGFGVTTTEIVPPANVQAG